MSRTLVSKRGISQVYDNFTCDRCGAVFSSDLQRKEWTGFIVCKWCLDLKHPQLEPYKYTRSETARPANPRPLITLAVGACNIGGFSAIVDYAQAGCAIVDLRTKFKG